MSEEKEEIKLNVNQEKFCQLFATTTEFFGNGTQSYIEAYNIDVSRKGAYAGARVNASQLLTNTNILTYINQIIAETGFTEEFADKQLSFLMTQNADFGAKLGAIREFNTLKQRITKKLDLTSKGESINRTELTPEQVKKIDEDLDKKV